MCHLQIIRQGESIFKRLDPIYFSPQNLLVSSRFSHGVLLLFSFLIPLMIFYSNCEDKGNKLFHVYKYLEDISNVSFESVSPAKTICGS